MTKLPAIFDIQLILFLCSRVTLPEPKRCLKLSVSPVTHTSLNSLLSGHDGSGLCSMCCVKLRCPFASTRTFDAEPLPARCEPRCHSKRIDGAGPLPMIHTSRK